jgi:hypothetical protein
LLPLIGEVVVVFIVLALLDHYLLGLLTIILLIVVI